MLAPLFGKQVAYSGGGYFRLYPYNFVSDNMKKNSYNICYFHIGDLIYNKEKIMTRDKYETYFQENGSLKNRILRYFKSHVGTKGAFSKMEHLFDEFEFMSLAQADRKLNWNNIDLINL